MAYSHAQGIYNSEKDREEAQRKVDQQIAELDKAEEQGRSSSGNDNK